MASSDAAALILQQEASFQGVLLSCIAYGTTIVLCVQCFTMLVSSKTTARNVHLLVFVVLVFVFGTIFQGIVMKNSQDAFVRDGIANGIQAFQESHFYRRISQLCNASFLILCVTSDILLLWRCVVIYRGVSVSRWYSIVIACAFWCAEFTLGVLWLVQVSRPAGSDWGAVNYTLGFTCLSLAVNIIATVLIVARFLYCRSRAQQILTSKLRSQYTSILAAIIESELLYTTFLIIYIALFSRNNPVAVVFGQPIQFVQTTAALLIVYRVAEGKAWSEDTCNEISTGTGLLSTVQYTHTSRAQADTSTCGEKESDIA